MNRRLVGLLVALVVLCGQAARAADQWVEISSAHFTVLTNDSEKQGRKTLDQFERMRWVFQKLVPSANVDPPVPIVVLAARDEKTFNALEPAAYLAKGSMKLGGYFLHSTDKNYILLRLDAAEEHPYAAVYHEYTHLQFASAAGWMPLWLNEGMAEFFQNAEISDKDVHLGQASLNDIYYLRDHPLVPLDVLLAVDQKSPYYHQEQKGSVFYAESWALTHYLIISDRQKHTHRLEDYETLVMNHEDPVTAGEKAFGGLKQAENELGDYIRQAMYFEFVLNSAEARIDESAYKVSPMTEAQAQARRADVLASVGRTDEARALLEAVLKSDPENVQAHETKGFLAFRAGKIEEAQQEYAEAVKAGSQDFLAYYYFSDFSMRRSATGESDVVVNSLRTAIKLNPRFAQSYDRLAAYFTMNHQNLDEARMLSLQAVQLDPASINYRVNAANVLMVMGKYDDALNVLKTAAKIARNEGDAALVQSRIQEAEQFRNARNEMEQTQQGEVRVEQKATAIEIAQPAHPTVMTAAPAHGAEGVIRGVECSSSYGIEFRVEGAPGKSVQLYNNNFTTIELTALGFTPPDSMNPCKDFEGMKASVRYVESPDKTVDGQVTAVELKK